MSTIQAVEIGNKLIGILSNDTSRRGFRFHSDVAPYDLLDGSVFSRLAEVHQAIRRLTQAAAERASASQVWEGMAP